MNTRGFTLLEMMIAISIASVVMLAALSRGFDSASLAKEEQESLKIKNSLISARNSARYGLKCVSVTGEGQTISVKQYTSCTSGLTGLISSQSFSFDSVISLSPFGATPNSSLVFNAQGGTMTGSTLALAASGHSGRIYQYNILPSIGKITMR